MPGADALSGLCLDTVPGEAGQGWFGGFSAQG